jgi:hypothetical protein
MDSHPIDTLGRRLFRKKRSLILLGMTKQSGNDGRAALVFIGIDGGGRVFCFLIFFI